MTLQTVFNFDWLEAENPKRFSHENTELRNVRLMLFSHDRI